MSARLTLTRDQADALHLLLSRGYDELEAEHEPGDEFRDYAPVLRVGDVLIRKLNTARRREGWIR